MTFPWEQLPAPVEDPKPPAAMSTEDTIAALQRDFAYAVKATAVLVHSNQPALEMLVNTARGQNIPKGVCRLSGGVTIEFQDIGMPQPGAPFMTVKDLVARVWEIVRELGLELQT